MHPRRPLLVLAAVSILGLTGCPQPTGLPQDPTGDASPEIPPGTLTGTLYSNLGTPVAGATAFVGDRTVTTDAQGKFALSDLGEGPYTVTFLKEGGYLVNTYVGLKGDEKAFILNLDGSEPENPYLAEYAITFPKADLPTAGLAASVGNGTMPMSRSLYAPSGEANASTSIRTAPGPVEIILTTPDRTQMARKTVTGTPGAKTTVAFTAGDLTAQTRVEPSIGFEATPTFSSPSLTMLGVFGDGWTFHGPSVNSFSSEKPHVPSGLTEGMKGYEIMIGANRADLGTSLYYARLEASAMPAAIGPIRLLDPPQVLGPKGGTASVTPTLTWQNPAGKGYTSQMVLFWLHEPGASLPSPKWYVHLAGGSAENLTPPAFPASLASRYPLQAGKEYSFEYWVRKDTHPTFGPGVRGETYAAYAYGSFTAE